MHTKLQKGAWAYNGELQTDKRDVNYYRLIIETVKEAFVTGGTGFLGAHLVSRLLQKGYHVDAIYRNKSKIADFERVALAYGLSPEQRSLLNWHEADLGDVVLLGQLIHAGHQVFHAAGMVSFDERKAERLYEANVTGTANMVNLCLQRGVKHFCHVSSTAAVGKTPGEQELITEETPWNRDHRHSVYAKSKYKAELELWRGIEEGLVACMVNPGVILGAGNWKYGTCRLFKLVHNGLKVYSPGLNGFIGVEDVTEAMIRLSEMGVMAERFILVSENLSFKSVLGQMADSLGVHPPSIGLPEGLIRTSGHLGSFLRKLGIPAPITRDYAASSVARHAYSSEKALKVTGLSFRPVHEVVQQVSAQYLSEIRLH